MAKQIASSFIGTVGGLTFYYSPVGGYLVRRTGGMTPRQYRKDKRYQAARDNSGEFGAVSRAGRLIREALRDFLDPVKDGTMVNRMNRELVYLKQHDNTHARGQRKPWVTMTDPCANKHFRIFQLNEKVPLYGLTTQYPQLETTRHTGAHTYSVNGFSPEITAFPAGATHAGITLVRTLIGFENETYRTTASRMAVVEKGGAADLSLEITHTGAAGKELVWMQVLFFREENGSLVQLRERVHAMGLIAVGEVDANTRGVLWKDEIRLPAKSKSSGVGVLIPSNVDRHLSRGDCFSCIAAAVRGHPDFPREPHAWHASRIFTHAGEIISVALRPRRGVASTLSAYGPEAS